MVTCDLYFFNPTCETAVANGSETFMAAQVLREFESDLSFLPMIFTSPGDWVLSEKRPSETFVDDLKTAHFPVSATASKSELLKSKKQEFTRMVPWGWSPAAHFYLKELKGRTSSAFRSSRVFNWQSGHRALYERKTSAALTGQFLAEFGPGNYCSSDAVASVLCSESEILAYLEKHRDTVLKSPVSSSGRGVQMIRDGKWGRSDSQWCNAVLQQMGYLMAEPLHRKKLDVSFQYEISASGKVQYCGHVFFYTNSNGMYQGHFINRDTMELIGTDFTVLLDETGLRLASVLEKSVYANLYEGFIGVDAMIVEESGQLKIHPCLEINCRLTMGMLALKAQKLIHPEGKGRFGIFTGQPGAFAAFSEKMKTEKPVILKEDRFRSGFLALTEPDPEAKFGAYLLLG